MTRISRRLRILALVIGAGLAANTALQAGAISDPQGDFQTLVYAGPPNPALDVLSANVILNPTHDTLTFTSTMAGPINTGPNSLVSPTGVNLGSFSWGINHGFGTNNFSQLGLPNVLFDAVLSLLPNGTGTYRGCGAGRFGDHLRA